MAFRLGPVTPQGVRNVLALLGTALLFAALCGYDWRLGVGFLGAEALAIALVGTFRA